MKILSAKQIKDWDLATLLKQNISGEALMERVSSVLLEWIIEHYPNQTNFLVFCGSGNNGGDGLALSRMLLDSGKTVTTIVIRETDLSEENKINLAHLKQINKSSIILAEEINSLAEYQDCLVIDALLGIGINAETKGEYKKIINLLNDSNHTVISIDMPSGLFSEISNPPQSSIINADVTLSFQAPKFSFMFDDHQSFLGKWHILDIGLDSEYLSQVNTNYYILDNDIIQSIYKPKLAISHKGSNGKMLSITGSFGKMGASILSTQSALRSGIGLLTVHIPGCGYELIQSNCPEALASVDSNKKHISQIPDFFLYDAILVGCGIGTEKATQETVLNLIKRCKKKLVIDADGLNILSEHKEYLTADTLQNAVLTPHPKEFDRLFGFHHSDYERFETAKQKAIELQTTIVLKGAITGIYTANGEVFFNLGLNGGMAKGGSGDVLAGIIASLCGSGYTTLDASLLGVYIHSLAGKIALEKIGAYSMLPSDIIHYLGDAFKQLDTKG